MDTNEVYKERQATLKQYWKFSCQCSFGRKSANEITASDERLRMIQHLEEKLHDWTQFSPEHIQMAESLVALYDAEHLWTSYIGHQAAAYAYSIQGDVTRTTRYAKKALKAVKLYNGVAYDSIHDLETLIESPTTHPSWLFKPHNTAG